MGWFGKGFYFSENPFVCHGYAEDGWLLLCLVWLGKAHKGMFIASLLTGHLVTKQTGRGLEKGYDSHISSDGAEIVIFHPDCILPCYIVKTKPNYELSKGEYLLRYLFRKTGIGRVIAQFVK